MFTMSYETLAENSADATAAVNNSPFGINLKIFSKPNVAVMKNV